MATRPRAFGGTIRSSVRIATAASSDPAVVEQAPAEAPLQLLAMTWLVALANIGFGLFPQFPLTLASAAAELLLEYTL